MSAGVTSAVYALGEPEPAIATAISTGSPTRSAIAIARRASASEARTSPST